MTRDELILQRLGELRDDFNSFRSEVLTFSTRLTVLETSTKTRGATLWSGWLILISVASLFVSVAGIAIALVI